MCIVLMYLLSQRVTKNIHSQVIIMAQTLLQVMILRRYLVPWGLIAMLERNMFTNDNNKISVKDCQNNESLMMCVWNGCYVSCKHYNWGQGDIMNSIVELSKAA